MIGPTVTHFILSRAGLSVIGLAPLVGADWCEWHRAYACEVIAAR